MVVDVCQTLYQLLAGQFKGRRGYDMVRSGQYVLEENSSGKDLDQRLPLSVCLRRGMKINMSMVFAVPLVSGSCPRCGTKTDAPEDVTTRW